MLFRSSLVIAIAITSRPHLERIRDPRAAQPLVAVAGDRDDWRVGEVVEQALVAAAGHQLEPVEQVAGQRHGRPAQALQPQLARIADHLQAARVGAGRQGRVGDQLDLGAVKAGAAQRANLGYSKKFATMSPSRCVEVDCSRRA